MLRKAIAIGAMIVATTAVAACGSSGPQNNVTGSNTAHRNAALQLSRCMRTHGVPQFPDIGGNGTIGISGDSNGSGATISVDGHQLNVSGPAFQKAMHECSKYGPKGPPISGAQLAQLKQGALKMAECMRTHGVPNFPDPQVTAGPGGHGIAIRMGLGNAAGGQARGTPPSPAFQRAMNTCQPLMHVGLKGQTKAS